MKRTKKAKRSELSNNGNACDVGINELGKIYDYYHPMETDFQFVVDDNYKRKLEKVFGVKITD